MSIILKAENISKQYRLGNVGTGTLGDDLKRWWYNLQGKEDPFLKVGGVNDRGAKATQDYVWALKDINFEVKQGEVLGIIGKNGAGKSTLLKLLSRVTAPTTGTIKTRGRIASLLEIGTGFHPELTGRENIFMNGAVLGMTKNEIKKNLDEIISFSGCEMYIDTPVKRYSSGMTVRLGFAVAAHLEPEILVVDEVLAVGDAEFQKKAIGKMQDLSTGEGRTVLFVSHNMASIQSLCTQVLLISNGTKLLEGVPDKIVEYYVSNSLPKIQSEVVLTNHHRKGKKELPSILKKIQICNPKPLIRDNLHFIIYFENHDIIQNYVCFTGSVCSLDNTRIGSFFTKPFCPTSGLNQAEIFIPYHNLSPGSYYLNISISNGNLKNDNLKTLDHAYETVYFQVSKENNKSPHLTEWNNSWGRIFFPSIVQLNNEEVK